jgi:DNA invertase Pin-like site-specific DNA recombinase
MGSYERSGLPASYGRRIGYARVSTEDQNLALQIDALTAAGCTPIFEDRITGAIFKRQGLDSALDALEPGGELVVWRLDRFGRTMLETVTMVLDLDQRGIGFRSLTESFDIKTAIGRGVLAFMAAIAEDERERIRLRTKAGMAAAKARGVVMGRPRKLTPAMLSMAREKLQAGVERFDDVAAVLNVSPVTLARALKRSDLAV